MTKDDRLKSLYITPAIAVTSLSLLVSLVLAAIGVGERLAWLGAALASAPMPILIITLMMRPQARTSEYLPLHLAMMVVGVVLAGRTMYGDFVTSWQLYQEFIAAVVAAFYVSEGSAPALVALASAANFLLYLFWYSRYGRFPDARLDVGATLPEFELTDSNGEVFRSSSLRGAPAVLLFYRGNWCPLCMAQIDEIVDRYEQLQKLGATVCLISPQPEEHTLKLAQKHGVDFRFLIDRDNALANELGIGVKNGVPLGVAGNYPPDSVMPTLVVTSPNGTVVFSDQTDNYRVRPEPDVFLAIPATRSGNARGVAFRSQRQPKLIIFRGKPRRRLANDTRTISPGRKKSPYHRCGFRPGSPVCANVVGGWRVGRACGTSSREARGNG